MSTRSTIAKLNLDGSIDDIYCHWDGYPSHNGRVLLENYTDADVVTELINLGDLSFLGEVIGEQHEFNSGAKDSEDACVTHMVEIVGKTTLKHNIERISAHSKTLYKTLGQNGFTCTRLKKKLGIIPGARTHKT